MTTTEQSVEQDETAVCLCGEPMAKIAVPRSGYDYRWVCPQADKRNYPLHVPAPKPDPSSTVLTVESALAELREMFPGEVFRVEISKDVRMGEDGTVSWRRDYACVLQPSRGLDGFYNAPTLRDAMDQVRAWHAEQAKES